MPTNLLIAFTMLLLALAAVGVLARFRVVARPDEWLLVVRDGRLIRAGVGILAWRRPGDVVARFTSTVQRVGFSVDVLSRDRVSTRVDGFILWTVAPESDGPFVAFRNLGIVDRGRRSPAHDDEKHLLSSPQHRAFRRLLAAAVQRLAAGLSLDELLTEQDRLVAALRVELERLRSSLGVHVAQVELVEVRPSDADLLGQMSATTQQRMREDAAGARIDADERIERRQLAVQSRMGDEKAAARRRELEHRTELELAQVEHARRIEQRRLEQAREQALAEEARALEVAQAVRAREELQLEARLDRIVREAGAQADAARSAVAVEEEKSQAVRDHELTRLVAKHVGEALGRLPLKEARWVTVGPQTPATSLAALISTAKELCAIGSDAG